ncbi:MAG: class I SAM-dependent methyltransferase [bacterium]
MSRAAEELGDELEHLHEIAGEFVPGASLGDGYRDRSFDDLSEQEIMEDWQVPLMKAMAGHVAGRESDVLEIGFGRGVSAEWIQRAGVRSHTIVEANPACVRRFFDPWRAAHRERDIRLVEGRWQDVVDRLDRYDAVFFHAVPLDERELREHMIESVTFAEHFFPVAAELLRPGGTFTYLTTEIDSLGREHQRSLLRWFHSVTLTVQPIEVPADTGDAWWARTMVVLKAVKA